MATDSPIDDSRLQEAIENRFQCARCGDCCKGDGVVRIGPEEAECMARQLGVTRQQLLKTYAVRWDAREWLLRDRLVAGAGRHDGDERWCIFLERGADGFYGCLLHDAKPQQCRDFPAKWRNTDSYAKCVGLRVLKADLRRLNG